MTDEEETAPFPTTYETPGPDTTDPPPPYEDQEESPKRVWQIRFTFMSDRQRFKKRGSHRPQLDWWANLEIETWDIAGVMRDGLFLTQENVQEEEGHARHDYWPKDKSWSYTRCYTIVDPRWSGYLHVCSQDIRPVANFRLHHLTANNVSRARVEDEEDFIVYCYNVDEPEHSANFIYDDMPMGGLWPWPKEEYVVESQSGHGQP
ncbi:hypothetical protein NCS52_00850700 [Fusarium sp. LHS14.1]|nr:hypothetical protein NCS52_00850700 [Fusarium sp. LHS14.1]